MKRFVISEDERARILSMHESATKRQYLSEQDVQVNPQGVSKAAETNAAALRDTEFGKAISKSEQFVKLLNDNNINILGLANSIKDLQPGAGQFKFGDHFINFTSRHYKGQDLSNAKNEYFKVWKEVQACISKGCNVKGIEVPALAGTVDSNGKNKCWPKGLNPGTSTSGGTGNPDTKCGMYNKQYGDIKKALNFDILKNNYAIAELIRTAPKLKA